MINLLKRTNYLLLLLSAIITYSCVYTNTLLIDIPQPSPKELPQSIQSLALISQTVNRNYTDIPSDSLQKTFFKQRFNLDTVIYDLQMADTTLKALGELLFESGRYDFVIPQQRFIYSQGKSTQTPLLPWKDVTDIAQSFNVDAVLSLDHLKTRVISKYDHETYYDPYQNGFYSGAIAQMKIYYEALFRVYDPANKSIPISHSIRDTLIWEDADISARSLFQHFTPVKQALAEAGIAIALELSDKMAVRWHTERRKYFSGGNDKLKRAGQLINKGETEAAIRLLKEVTDKTKSKSLKSKAQLNIALSYEIMGYIDRAVSWALKSYETYYRPMTYEYLEILKRRKNKLINQSQ
jgi:tetratricopeptide (TPR) repeat protein